MQHKSLANGNNLKSRIENACKGLVYISETDAAIEAFIGDGMAEPTAKELLRKLGRTDQVATESSDPGDFFNRLTTSKPWHTDKQSRDVRRFKNLRRLLEKELEDIRVVRIGKIRIDIFVIGKSRNGKIAGIKTFSVET